MLKIMEMIRLDKILMWFHIVKHNLTPSCKHPSSIRLLSLQDIRSQTTETSLSFGTDPSKLTQIDWISPLLLLAKDTDLAIGFFSSSHLRWISLSWGIYLQLLPLDWFQVGWPSKPQAQSAVSDDPIANSTCSSHLVIFVVLDHRVRKSPSTLHETWQDNHTMCLYLTPVFAEIYTWHFTSTLL